MNEEILDIAKSNSNTPTENISVFNNRGMAPVLSELHDEIRGLYTADEIPWVIGYSGGKDSTATVQLVWSAIQALPPNKRTKEIHVISTDTLVENPLVAASVNRSLIIMQKSAESQGVPIRTHRLVPRIEDSFWVNLIGKGYPSPRHTFRWCTERLKIKPSNAFIKGLVSKSNQAILVLGTRKAESIRRAANMMKHAAGRLRDRLSPNSSLPGSLIYSPIEDWSNDDVWFYLLQVKNPWAIDNNDLLKMYAGASEDGECPLVVDESTPSCGDSRFGCWVCTLVEKDKSMTAMIKNDSEKAWMMPLLELRNALDFRGGGDQDQEASDRHLRDFRRMTGIVQIMSDGRPVPGPYTQASREMWLVKILEAQEKVKKAAPSDLSGIELITLEELKEIRRIWVMDKHELEDSLPKIYEKVTGKAFPAEKLDDNLLLNHEDMAELATLCGDDQLHYELTRELLSVSIQNRLTGRRAKLNEKLESALKRNFYENQEDALSRAQELDRERMQIREGLQK